MAEVERTRLRLQQARDAAQELHDAKTAQEAELARVDATLKLPLPPALANAASELQHFVAGLADLGVPLELVKKAGLVARERSPSPSGLPAAATALRNDGPCLLQLQLPPLPLSPASTAASTATPTTPSSVLWEAIAATEKATQQRMSYKQALLAPPAAPAAAAGVIDHPDAFMDDGEETPALTPLQRQALAAQAMAARAPPRAHSSIEQTLAAASAEISAHWTPSTTATLRDGPMAEPETPPLTAA